MVNAASIPPLARNEAATLPLDRSRLAELVPAAALANTSNPCILAFKNGVVAAMTLITGLLPLLPKFSTSIAWNVASASFPVLANTSSYTAFLVAASDSVDAFPVQSQSFLTPSTK